MPLGASLQEVETCRARTCGVGSGLLWLLLLLCTFFYASRALWLEKMEKTSGEAANKNSAAGGVGSCAALGRQGSASKRGGEERLVDLAFKQNRK